jgi:cupin 2 domain-containing protein
MNNQYPDSGNIFSNLPNKSLPEEYLETLFKNKNFKIERIISTGQITPENEWYDQDQDEWVILLKGNARILFFDENEIELNSGDYTFISAHKKHRVTWTDPKEICVWLAFHINTH